MFKTSVRLPDGRILTADVGGLTNTGYRFASVRVNDVYGIQRRVSGRITTRHGYGKPIQFETKVNGVNALAILEGTNSYA